jgi:hypothetical protein
MLRSVSPAQIISPICGLTVVAADERALVVGLIAFHAIRVCECIALLY